MLYKLKGWSAWVWDTYKGISTIMNAIATENDEVINSNDLLLEETAEVETTSHVGNTVKKS